MCVLTTLTTFTGSAARYLEYEGGVPSMGFTVWWFLDYDVSRNFLYLSSVWESFPTRMTLPVDPLYNLV